MLFQIWQNGHCVEEVRLFKVKRGTERERESGADISTTRNNNSNKLWHITYSYKQLRIGIIISCATAQADRINNENHFGVVFFWGETSAVQLEIGAAKRIDLPVKDYVWPWSLGARWMPDDWRGSLASRRRLPLRQRQPFWLRCCWKALGCDPYLGMSECCWNVPGRQPRPMRMVPTTARWVAADDDADPIEDDSVDEAKQKCCWTCW